MENLRIVVTGASDGIGKAMAIAFAKQGARLALFARRKELLETLALELRKLGSPEVLVFAVDVTDHAAQRAALENCETHFKGITHLVLNAGITGRTNPWEDSWQSVRECLDVNVMAALNAAEWIKPRMVARKSGTIAGVSSIAATRGLPDSGAYSCSKAALSSYLESLRVDLAHYGVKVVTIAPGYIKTAIAAKNRGTMPFLMDADKAGQIFADAVIEGKRFKVAPWQYIIAIWIMRFMPGPVYDFVITRYMKRVRGSDPASRRQTRKA